MTQSHLMEKPLAVEPVAGRASSRVIGSILAATAIGLSIRLANGEYSSQAIFCLTIGVVAAISGVGGFVFSHRHRVVLIVMLAAISLQFVIQLLYWPGVDLQRHTDLRPFFLGIAGAILLLIAGLIRPAKRLWFPLLLLVSLLLNYWMVACSQGPYIDSWNMQQEAGDRLLHGDNPYAMTFTDIYQSTHPGTQRVYGQGLVVNSQTTFGFPYPPLSLILSTIGYALSGDHRYAQATAVTIAGLLIGYSRRGLLAKLGAVLLLFTPTEFLVIGRSWTEPFSVMLLAAVVFCSCRNSKWLPIALGLALAAKQYMVLALPISFLLLPGNWRWRDWVFLVIQSALVAAAVTLPFAFWNWHKFLMSIVTVQRLAPFRWDALSYLVWYGKHWNMSATSPLLLVWSVLGTTVVVLLAIGKAERSPAGFAAALGLVSLAFFSLNKQAFCNYYFFTTAAFCCAIASAQLPVNRQIPE